MQMPDEEMLGAMDAEFEKMNAHPERKMIFYMLAHWDEGYQKYFDEHGTIATLQRLIEVNTIQTPQP